MLDEERQAQRPDRVGQRRAPADHLAIRSAPLAWRRVVVRSAELAQPRHVAIDVVRGDRKRSQPLVAGLEQRQRRRPDPPAAGEVRIEHAHQFEIGIAEEDQPVERAVALVATAAPGLDAKLARQPLRAGVRIACGDDEMVDAQQHPASVSPAPVSG